MKLPRRQFLYLATGASALPAVSRIVRAQAAYPTRPVRIIVPYAPGGGTDFAARVIGEYLSRAIGQQVIIENKSGGSSMIGTETAAKAPPDGYTVLVTTDSIASVPHIVNFNTDYVKDLVPVILLARNPIILAAHPTLGVNSVAELIRVAKMRPEMGYATAGVGSQQHFVAEWFAQIAGIKLDHVPYRGAGQAVNDLVAGHVRIAFLARQHSFRNTRPETCSSWRNRVRCDHRACQKCRRLRKLESTDSGSIYGLAHLSLRAHRQRLSHVSTSKWVKLSRTMGPVTS